MSEKNMSEPIAKRLHRDLTHLRVTNEKSEEWGEWVKLTAALVDRPYMATHKLVENWPLEKVKRHYIEATKHAGLPPHGKTLQQWQAILWWSKRKKDTNTKA